MGNKNIVCCHLVYFAYGDVENEVACVFISNKTSNQTTNPQHAAFLTKVTSYGEAKSISLAFNVSISKS